MFTLYVYSGDIEDGSTEHVATITGPTNEACEMKAEELYGSNDYSWTYSPAFGFAGGLTENPEAEEIEVI